MEIEECKNCGGTEFKFIDVRGEVSEKLNLTHKVACSDCMHTLTWLRVKL